MSGDTQVTTPDDLRIRSAPAPVRRFSKRALALLLGGASLLVLGSFAFAMNPQSRNTSTAPRELYSTTNKPRADGLSNLPVSYADIKPDAPVLGPPLPGDLGGPILAAQKEGGFAVQIPLKDRPVIDQAEVDAALAEQAGIMAARESQLFFSNAGDAAPVADRSARAATLQPAAARDPFAVLGAPQLSGQGGLGRDANLQGRKMDFLSEAPDASIYNPHRIETPVSPWQVMAGTIIPATLLTGINSDLPGQVVGQVTEPVYDTVTGNTVLIPQGSRVVGRYDSVIAYGQSRALIVWHRIIMPDGTSIRIENLPAVDGRGNAGLKDRVDTHALRLFSAAALSSLISIGAELSNDDEDDIARALRDASQVGASRVGDEIVRNQLSVQPTITIRPGWRLRILVHQDIILQPYGDN
tara:strand:- start:15257 stop:16492 length:1236 start_codon:yes stop_codon:yes gene_type:complete